MKRTKSILAAALALGIAFGLIACGGKKDESSGTNGGTAQTGGNSSSGGGVKSTSKHVVINYMTTGNKPTNGATEKMLEKLNAILNEKCNAELQIYYIPWTDYLTNYNLTLAQMDGSVDLVGTATDWLDAWKNSKNGAFLPLTEDMLKTNCPKTYASVSKEHWEMCKYNGDIYLIPEDNYAQWINHGFMYRGDWAKEAGLTNGVHSWEDMTTYFRSVKQKHPDIIPWDSDGGEATQLSGGYFASKNSFIPLDGINVYGMFGVNKSNLKKIYSPFLEGDDLVEFAKLMKQWDELGVWKKDVLNNTSSSNREEMYLGQVAAEQHHTQTWYTNVRPKLDENVPGSDCQFFWFGEESKTLTRMLITHGAMAISAGSKNPERALMVYDLIRNDKDCYNLFNYGILGEQYVIDGNGYRDRPAGYTDDANGITTNYWWGRNDDLEIRDAKGAWPQYDEISKIYESVAIDYPYGQIVWDVDNINTQLENISDVQANYMTRIAYGKVDDPAKFVAEYRAALKKAGIESVIAEVQKQVDAFLAGK